jgi:hypothetical protein
MLKGIPDFHLELRIFLRQHFLLFHPFLIIVVILVLIISGKHRHHKFPHNHLEQLQTIFNSKLQTSEIPKILYVFILLNSKENVPAVKIEIFYYSFFGLLQINYFVHFALFGL